MSVVSNIQSMSDAIDKLTQRVSKLNQAVGSVGTSATKAFGNVLNGVSSQGGQLNNGVGSTTMMGTSLGRFSTSLPINTSMGGMAAVGAISAVGNIGVGLAKVALSPLATAYAGAMPTGDIVNSATSYYQAALRAPGISRSSLETATFNAMRGGMTSVGSPAVVSNILANSGFMPGTSQYTQAAQQVALMAQKYGIENSAAAGAVTSFSNMNTANTLFSTGITTLDAKGNALKPGDIAKQIIGRLYPNGVNSAQLNRSIQYGSFQNQLSGLGITDSTAQQAITGAAFNIASGKDPNAVNQFSNNKNPQSALFAMNASQTNILQKSEANALSGLDMAAKYVTAFNNAMGPMIETMARFKAFADGVSSTNAGKGTKAGASSLINGLKKIGGGVIAGVGAVLTATGVGAEIGIPLMLAGGGIAASGGGTPGFGGSFKGNIGGGTPGKTSANPLVSAGYGATSDSGIWGSTGNTHQGVDYSVPTGTAVHATADGVVSGKTLSADYGQAIILSHKNGFSSIYAHLSNKEVGIGKAVKAGDEIGKSGASGNVTGPSLHYEVWKGDNNPVNPSVLPNAFLSPVSMGSLADVKNPAKNTAVNPMAGSSGDRQFAKALLQKAGIKPTDSNMIALTTWMHWEGGTANNAFNPLNTTLDMQGAGLFNKEGVKTYNSLSQGVDATYQTLTGANASGRGYTKILSDLKANASLGTVIADVNNSSWGTNIHGGGNPGYGSGITSSSGGGGSINNVSINVTVANASDSEAQLFAKKVKEYLANDSSVLAMGSY